jgi:hypothetical protein
MRYLSIYLSMSLLSSAALFACSHEATPDTQESSQNSSSDVVPQEEKSTLCNDVIKSDKVENFSLVATYHKASGGHIVETGTFFDSEYGKTIEITGAGCPDKKENLEYYSIQAIPNSCTIAFSTPPLARDTGDNSYLCICKKGEANFSCTGNLSFRAVSVADCWSAAQAF